ncbi:MAG: Rne/Rng family ribonuclease [Chitinispirillaceae bacterium]|nr:Rne/Rng family ribonuclease [Chitinispirillaceae bacterium]
MSTKKILFNATSTEKRAALLEHDKVTELVVERPDNYRIAGNIYRGRVRSVLPGLQAAFVDIGLERAAFLHASDIEPSVLLGEDDALLGRYRGNDAANRRKIIRIPIEKLLQKGQEILVQVIKEEISTKGAKLTTQISMAGRFLVLVPDADFIGVSKRTQDLKKRKRLKQLIAQIKPPGVGFIVRTMGLKVSEAEFVREIHLLLDAWRTASQEALKGSGPKLIHREMGITTRVIRDLFSEDVGEVYVDQQDDYQEILEYLKALSPDLCKRVVLYNGKEPLFDKFNIEKDLERLLKRKVWMRSGGYILIDRTEALVAIDVNTGRNIGKTKLEDTIFQTNMEAVGEICRQLRLRDIGGLIVIDFIDMRYHNHRRQIEQAMLKALAADPTAADCTGLSKFCLMEITRKRVRPELQEFYTDVCHACGGLGWVFSPETVTARIDRELGRFRGQKKELRLAVHPSVSAYLLQENGKVKQMLEQERGCTITCIADEELDQDEYTITPMQKGGQGEQRGHHPPPHANTPD